MPATTANGWPYVLPDDRPVEFPAHSQALAEMLDAGSRWTSWSPTLNGFTCSAVSAYYARSKGGVVHVNALFTIAAVTGPTTFVLPINSLGDAQGNAMLLCAGGNYVGQTRIAGATGTCAIDAINTGGTYATRANLTATVPAAWAAGDKIISSITYRAAAA